MTRRFSALAGLAVLGLGLPMLLAGCGGEIPEPVETAPGVTIETVALAVEGMT